MLSDLWTVTRKELLEIVNPDGRPLGGAKNILVLMGIAGLLFPLQAGPRWLSSWTSIYSACFPAILMVNYAADAFAGERERHTLETLLASRLPDPAILLGKVLAIVVLGWVLIVGSQLLAVVALTLAFGGGHLLLFQPAIALWLLLVAALLPLLLTAAGVSVSMTASTVRVAGQRLLVPFIAIYGLPAAVPYLAQKAGLGAWLASLSPERIAVAACLAAAVASAALLTVAWTRFKRERLVLA